MTEKESRNLKKGDIVVSGGVRGIVKFCGYYGIRCQWDDGQRGFIYYDDMQDVSRNTGEAATP